MRALTVQQPWAWAIVHGGKDVENRTRNLAGSYRGPVAIHAGARWSEHGGRSGLVWDVLRDRYGWPTGPGTARRDPRPGFDTIRPLGAFIGVVDLVGAHVAHDGCCPGSEWAERDLVVETYRGPLGQKRSRFRVHLVLANPRPLPEPIPCRGRLGLWTPQVDILEQLQAVV